MEGKIGGSFGSYTHSGDAPKIIFETMEFVYNMKMVRLGYFNVKESDIGKPDYLKACHDYGKAIGEE